MRMLAIFLAVLLPVCVSAQTQIIGIEIPGLHEKSGAGAYDQIINTILVEDGSARLEVYPPARAEHLFSKCTDCCFSPANKNPEFYDYGDDIVQTDPMSTAKIYIFTAAGQPVISNLSELKGKKVGTRFGMPYGETFDKMALKTEAAQTIKANIKKVMSGRLDAFVAYVPDAYQAFKDMNMEPLPHDRDNPVAVHDDCLVCREVSGEFIQKFNRKLKAVDAE